MLTWVGVRLSTMDIRCLREALDSHLKYAKPKMGDRDEVVRLANRLKSIRLAIDSVNNAVDQYGLTEFGYGPIPEELG